MVNLLLYLVIGALAGTFAGLLGVGGGIIIVPALVFAFQAHGFSPDVLVHMAVGTSLATIVPTSISSVSAHHRHGAVDWPLMGRLTVGIVIGALLGAGLADLMPGHVLRTVFALFALVVSLQLALRERPAAHRQLPGTLGLAAAGLVIGTVSALVGIGGGSMTVPFLAWCNVSMRKAIAVSAACGLPIAVAGSIGFVLTGLRQPHLPPWTTGYLYWPAGAGIAMTSVLFAPLGARLTHRIPATALRRVFAVFLAVVGVRLLIH